tara:strand:+ start:81663 stop:82964 length:1302 start_codon:yes stop_codon:yes gene_type:complete
MPDRESALSNIVKSPARILVIVLLMVFAVEVAVMFVLPHLVPRYFGDVGIAFVDAVLLTLICAPALWWIIIGPLRRIAIQEHQRSETIVSNASEGIISFDRMFIIDSCNRACTSLFELRADELIGRSIHDAIPNLPLEFSRLPSDYRLEGVRDSGSEFPIHVSISEYPSDSGRQYVAIIRDLTLAQEAELQRITMARETEALRAQQMTTLAQLATGVAHEIRNPLTSIKMLIQVNRAKFAEKGLPTDDMELVEQEIRRMERSVESLLEYARPEKTEFCRFEIGAVVSHAMKLVDGRCAAQNVKLSVALPEKGVEVSGDPAQFRQMLVNLMLNGLDAMPTGGQLSITVTPTDHHVEVIVADTGPGIAKQVFDRIFSPFVTTKPNGVGLGLGICRRIAESHHGTLEATNGIDGGAQFKLTLPMTSETALSTRKES